MTGESMQVEATMTVAAPATRLHLWVAAICGAVLFLEGYDIAAVGYAIPSLVDAWKIHPSAFTHVLTAGNVGLLVGSLCAGLLGDQLGRKPVLITCVTLFGVFSLLSAIVHSPSQLEGMRFLTGLGLGGGLPIAVALASDFSPRETQGRLVILMSAAVPIGFTVGGLLASWLVGIFGWPAIFIAGGVLPLVVVPLLVLWLPESIALRAASQPRNLASALFQNGLAPSTVLLWAINVLSFLGIYFILLWTPTILYSAGVSSSRAILGTAIYGLGVIVSPFITALFVGRFGIERVLAYGLAFGALCGLTIGLFNPQIEMLFVILFGLGIGGGCQAGINSLSALAYPPAIRSTGTGWALGVGRAGTIAGPLLGGLLLGLGFQAQKIFAIASIPAFVAALLMAILWRLRRSM
jgi:AAHS family 4-hydroxybenzoate transporter-like MFS transporter